MVPSFVPAAQALQDSLQGLDARLYSGDDAATGAELLALTEKICAAARIKLAQRAAECGAHRDRGFSNPSEWLARETGDHAGRAKADLELAAALESLSDDTRAAVEADDVSLQEGSEIAKTEAECPGSEAEMLEEARRRGLRGLKEKGRRKRQEARSADELARKRRKARHVRTWTNELGNWSLPPRTRPSRPARQPWPHELGEHRPALPPLSRRQDRGGPPSRPPRHRGDAGPGASRRTARAQRPRSPVRPAHRLGRFQTPREPSPDGAPREDEPVMASPPEQPEASESDSARPASAESGLGIPHGATGILASQHLERAIATGVIDAPGDEPVPTTNVQPASIDLRLGPVAYRIRCSFLPGSETVEAKMKGLVIDELSLEDEGAVLETGLPYVIPLAEHLALPAGVRGKTNPKSSTGRLDVFTRVITDGGFRFDEIAEAYDGPLWLEVVPLSFPVRVRHGLSLNQLRLAIGQPTLTDDDIRATHRTDPLLYEDGEPVADDRLAVANGLFVNLDLRGDRHGRVGYRARRHVLPVDMSKTRAHQSQTYWEPVFHEPGDRIVLEPEGFYLLLSRQAVRIPPHFAAEMTAFDPTSGELRTHYAGFFDPGFGHDPTGRFKGSRAALEVRAHDVPFMIEHLQRVCKLTFETMIEPPATLYGQDVGSSYQGQTDTLSKHFVDGSPRPPVDADQDQLFGEPGD